MPADTASALLALKAYRARLKASGDIRGAEIVLRCINLVRAAEKAPRKFA